MMPIRRTYSGEFLNLHNVTNVVNLNVNRSFNRFPSFKEETLDIYPQTYHHSLVIASKRASVQNKICGDGNGICNTKLN